MPAQKRLPDPPPPPPPPTSAIGDEAIETPAENHLNGRCGEAEQDGPEQSPPKKLKPDEEEEEEKEKNSEANDGGDGSGAGNDASSESESEDEASAKEEFVPVKLADIRKEVQCPICLGIIRKTRTVMECLHRFCRECIDKSMRLGNNECPACRTHCASRRSLRDDPNYDALIAALYPDIDKYEEEELAFNEEENDRNKKIQASIAEAFRKQEVFGRRPSARATAAAFVRRSRRNFRANGLNNHGRGRGRAVARNFVVTYSDDEDGNDFNYGKESSSAEEISPDKRQNRYHRWPTPGSSPARAAGNDAGGSDEKDDVGVGIENLTTSPLRAWGKNGTRSQTRHGSSGGSNNRMVKGGRLTKLVECLRNSDEADNEIHVILCLHPPYGQTRPNFERAYLCCRSTISVNHLCQFIALQSSCQAEEVKIYAKKPQFEESTIPDSVIVIDKEDSDRSEDLQLLAGEKSLAELNPIFISAQGNMDLVYAINMQS